MTNWNLGEHVDIVGKAAIRGRPGSEGHLLYGPYTLLGKGRYVVTFAVALGEDIAGLEDRVGAVIDVVSHFGRLTYERSEIPAAALGRELATFALTFDVHDEAEFEFRL